MAAHERHPAGRTRPCRPPRRPALREAPDGYAGETVEVLYDPYDPGRPVHFRRKGETAEKPLRRLDLATNATLRRVARHAEPVAEAPKTGISYLELVAKKFYGGDNE